MQTPEENAKMILMWVLPSVLMLIIYGLIAKFGITIFLYFAYCLIIGVQISYSDQEAKKQRRLYKEGYALKFNLFMSHFLLLALWLDFFYTGFLFIREVNLKAF